MTARVKLSYPQAVRLAEEVVAEQGADYQYEEVEACVYFDEVGNPSCLVGHMFYRLGVKFEEDEKAPAGDLNGKPFGETKANLCGIEHLVNVGFVEADRPTKVFLTKLQEAQDDGNAWGDCLAEAKQWVIDISTPEDASAETVEVREQVAV